MVRPQLLSRPLKAFIKLAETLSYGDAAKALEITQPALTQQIKKLEEELGDVRLFDRGRGGVELTPVGEAFLAYAHRAKQELEFGAEAVDASRGLQRGTLRVGYSQGQLDLVSEALQALMDKEPGLTVSVNETMAVRVGELVLEGRLDVGLAYNWQASDKLEVRPLEPPVELVLVVHKEHRLAGSPRLKDIRILEGEPFILLQGGLAVRRTIDSYAASRNFRPRVVVETDDAQMIFSLVRENKGVTLFPVTPYTALGPLVTVPLPSPATQTIAVLSRKGVDHPTVRLFIETIEEMFDPRGKRRAPVAVAKRKRAAPVRR